MIVTELDEHSISDYEKLWSTSHNATLFTDYKWLSIVVHPDQHCRYYGIYEDNNLVAAFPLVQIKSRLLVIYSLPYLTPYMGCFTNDNYMGANLSAISDVYFAFIAKLKADNFTMAFAPNNDDTIFPIKNKYSINQRHTYTIDLKDQIEVILKNFKTDKKRNIKAAVKEGLTVSFDKNPETMGMLIKKTYSRQSQEASWINQAVALLNNYENCFQVTVSVDDKPASCLFIAYANKRSYYLFGGYDDSLNNFNAGPFAMWNAIQKSKELGMEIFDFEGSEIPAIEKYFQRFGSKKCLFDSIEYKSMKQKLVKIIR
ncbi:MAG: lipid II:glycine glycyltransferase (peptidoglycan interpeptide bridge formation enzyme) [Salibacteraceae bacterium]|jgi:lipid II:glycine glycyltransferase (peptidoglycan interpeptide bridge formation enzyme)